MLRFPAAPVIHEQDHLGKSDRVFKTEKLEVPVSKYVNVGQGREEAELEGNYAKSVHRSRARPVPESGGAQLLAGSTLC